MLGLKEVAVAVGVDVEGFGQKIRDSDGGSLLNASTLVSLSLDELLDIRWKLAGLECWVDCIDVNAPLKSNENSLEN